MLLAYSFRKGTCLSGAGGALFRSRECGCLSQARNKYVSSADGQRFLFDAPLGRESMTPTTVVLNWFAGLGK